MTLAARAVSTNQVSSSIIIIFVKENCSCFVIQIYTLQLIHSLSDSGVYFFYL